MSKRSFLFLELGVLGNKTVVVGRDWIFELCRF